MNTTKEDNYDDCTLLSIIDMTILRNVKSNGSKDVEIKEAPLLCSMVFLRSGYIVRVNQVRTQKSTMEKWQLLATLHCK
uniref:Uncharacterized protein n=1 Tax=Nelumbo nucifera TaxID=4432 RepID=A0A822YR78_NELNU|nr:TPA_asm: hypothetical protein HUJ06_012750 [Nelumbo nucifera]